MSQAVKEPLLCSSTTGVLFKSSDTHRNKKLAMSCLPLPHRQFLKVHGSIFLWCPR